MPFNKTPTAWVMRAIFACLFIPIDFESNGVARIPTRSPRKRNGTASSNSLDGTPISVDRNGIEAGTEAEAAPIRAKLGVVPLTVTIQ